MTVASTLALPVAVIETLWPSESLSAAHEMPSLSESAALTSYENVSSSVPEPPE